MDIKIDHLGIAELIALNKKVVARVRALQSEEQLKAACQFHLGDVVSFLDGKKNKISGVVLSIKKTKASILTEDREQWTVPPSLLSIENKPSKKLLRVKEGFFPKSLVIQFPKRK